MNRREIAARLDELSKKIDELAAGLRGTRMDVDSVRDDVNRVRGYVNDLRREAFEDENKQLVDKVTGGTGIVRAGAVAVKLDNDGRWYPLDPDMVNLALSVRDEPGEGPRR